MDLACDFASESETDDASFLEDSDTDEDTDLNVQGSADEAEASEDNEQEKCAPKDNKRQTGKVKFWLHK